jgi:hypothetical protein
MADNNRDQVLACLTEAAEPLSIRNITATTGLKSAEVKEVLDALNAEGRAASAKSGRTEQWSLTDPEAGPEAEPTGPTEPAEAAAAPPELDTPAEAVPTGPAPEAGNTEPAPPQDPSPDDTTANGDDDGRVPGNDNGDGDGDGDEADTENEDGTPVPAPVDAEVVFVATMLDQLGERAAFTVESFARACGKSTATERNRLLRALWALAEHALLDKSDPNNVDGGEWTVTAPGLAAAAVERRIQVDDAPNEIEVRTVKRMPWAANGGARSGRSPGSGLRGDLKPSRVRGELREQIDAVLAALPSGEVVTPGWVAEAVRTDDPHHREADPNAVNNYLRELRLQGRVADASAEHGGRAYRLA